MNYSIDNVDRVILNMLLQDARTSYNVISENAHVSPGTVHVRMKKMEQAGIVKKSQINVDFHKLGLDITAFIGIYLEKSSFIESVKKELSQVNEISNLFYTTGSYGLLALIRCRDTNHLRDTVQDKIQSLNGIQRTETIISLEEVFSRSITL